MQGLIEIQYLPPLAYFCALLATESVAIEKHEYYVKQSYRNRCYINTANGIFRLVVPIVRQSGKVLIKDSLIDNCTQWQSRHWKAIELAYRKAPFFDHYADQLRPLFFRKYKYLYDMNYMLLSFCLHALDFPVFPVETALYQKNPDRAAIKDFRSIISPKKTRHSQLFYTPIAYFQIFGSKFAENLSLIDLLFCEGPNAMQILESSATQRKQG